ncbi:MAG TPA: Calx-beta domain-containing protein [Polyangiaceae bacterium]|nr:Calx-beta domain-containing protein [Polyangiaceae bacterium]
MAFLALVVAMVVLAASGCTKVLGDFQLGPNKPPVVDAGKEVTPVDIVVTPTEGLQTTEWGGRVSFTIVLKTAPRFNVAIALSSSTPTEGTVSPESVTFTPINWNAPQTVYVTGVQDEGYTDGNTIYTIETSPASSDDMHFTGMDPPDVAVINVDDETPGFIVTPLTGLTTTELGAAATFTVALTAPPDNIVTVDLATSRPKEGKVSPSSLAFSGFNYRSPQTVTVTGMDDNDIDGPAPFQIVTSPAKSGDLRYDGLNAPDVQVVNIDDDGAGVTIAPLGGLVTSEGGLASAITISLNTAPTADVSIGFTSSLPKEGAVNPSKVTFTALNWKAPQTVVVTGVNDDEPDGNQLYMIAVGAVESSDDRFKGIDPPDLDAINVDDDSAGLIVTPQRGLVTGEDGQAATFTVALAAKPSGDVTLDLSSSAPSEGSINPRRITFTQLNWKAPQVITVSGVDDGNSDGDASYQVRGTVDVGNSDPDYGALPAIEVSIINIDNDTPGINITPLDGLITTERGGKASFAVSLRSKPTGSVQINLSSSSTAEGTVFPPSLLFTQTNFAAPQKVTVTGVDDTVRDGNQRFSIVTDPAPAITTDDFYRNIDPPNVTIVNLDDDTAGVVVVQSTDAMTTTEGGGTATFTLQLSTQPKSEVAINLASSNPTEGEVSPAIVTFTASNWSSPQIVTVLGKDDGVIDGPQPYLVLIASTSSSDADYRGIEVEDIPVLNLDDETPAVVVSAASPLLTTESGGSATFTVALGSQPASAVTLVLLSSRTTEATISPSTMVFTSVNWQSPQVVTVTGADDIFVDGNQPYTIILSSTSSTDSGYNNLKPLDLAAINIDDETPGVNVIAARGLTTSENGATAQFSVVLNSPPKSNVAIAMRSTLPTEGTVSPTSLVFSPTDWNAPRKITVTGVDDGTLADGALAYKIILDTPTGDAAYTVIDPSDVDLVNLDNDTPAIQVIAPKVATTSEWGGATSFGVFLMAQPVDEVTIPIVSSDPSECTLSRETLKFTRANWSTPQWVTVTGADDMSVDGDVPYRISIGPAMGANTGYQDRRGSNVLLVNLDNDTPGLAISPPQGSTTEGGIATNFTVALTTPPTAAVNVPIVSARPREGMPLTSSLIFTPDNWNAPQTVTVRGVDDVIVDGDQVYRIAVGPTASGDTPSGTGDPNYRGRRAPDVVITNLDDDGAGIRVTAAPDLKTTEAGGTAKFTVVLASAPTGPVSVPLISRDPSEGTITDPSSGTLVFTAANWSMPQTVTVTGANDGEADGNVPYAIHFQPAISVVDTRYAERTADDLMLTNVDDESPGVTISGAQNLITTEAGGTATFRMVLNMAPIAGVTFFLRSSRSTEGTVPDNVQFSGDDWNIPHTVTITGQQDTIADGNQVYSIMFEPSESSDKQFDQLVLDPLPVTNLDDDMSPLAKQRRTNLRPRRDPAPDAHPAR